MKTAGILIICLLVITIDLFSQQFMKPSEGKSLVYFVRFRGALALVDFKYFDGDKYLGRVSGNNFFVYECDPGEHVFWVSAENIEFIKGNLKPNQTYVIEVRPYLRAVMAGAELYQVAPEDKKALEKIDKVINKEQQAEMRGLEVDQSALIKTGMEKLENKKQKVTKLKPDWTF